MLKNQDNKKYHKKTIIFDMDGVLADTEPYHCQAWINALDEAGIKIDEKYYFEKVCGNSSMVSAAMLLEEHNKTHLNPEGIVDRKSFHAYDIIVKQGIKPFPGVVELIRDLIKKGYVLGLASSTAFLVINALLESLKIKHHFSVIHGPEAVKNGKPDPDVYLLTAKILDVDPWDAIVIEDSKSGVISAKRAGAKCIAYLNGHNRAQDLGLADHITDSFYKINEKLFERI